MLNAASVGFEVVLEGSDKHTLHNRRTRQFLPTDAVAGNTAIPPTYAQGYASKSNCGLRYSPRMNKVFSRKGIFFACKSHFLTGQE